MPMKVLDASLGNPLSRIVVDKTGLAGAWDFKGAWEIDPAPDSAEGSGQHAGDRSGG
jgi:uncharacterized protein (TIGR03435 family)